MEKLLIIDVNNTFIIRRNMELISLQMLDDIQYCIDDFSFNLEQIHLKNSRVFSNAKIFD